MAPFRSAYVPDDQRPIERVTPPELIAFGAREDVVVAALASNGIVRVVELRQHDASVLARHAFEVPTDAACVAAVGRERWMVGHALGRAVVGWTGPARHPVRGELAQAALGDDTRVVAASLDGRPSVVTASAKAGEGARGPTVRAITPGADDVTWHGLPTSRVLLAASATVAGPVAVFATDREDEVDVCAKGGDVEDRTVSLGRGQRFECAVGGGSRVLVVSRGADGLVVRTLARDLRSELNPVILRPRTGATVGTARCAYVNGPFVVAHEEHDDGAREVVVTVFDAGQTTTARTPLPRLDAIASHGRDLLLAALLPGAAAPILVVQRVQLAAQREKKNAYVLSPRRYAYLLDAPPCDAPQQRRALLADVAEVVSLSLGARAPRDLALRAHDDRSDEATFEVPGPDAARDLSFAFLLRDDGSGVASVRIGPGDAPPARGLAFVERVRQAFTGDDDADPTTTRLELSSVSREIERVVASVWGLRLAR